MAIALSQQLQLDQDDTSTKRMTGTTKMGNTASNHNNGTKAKTNATPSSSGTGNNLQGGDSIYSNYLRGISAIDTIDNTTSSFHTSMFDSLINNKSTTNTTTNNNTSAPAAITKSATTAPVTTQVVLDSDISDSDEEHSEESEDDSVAGGRITKGVQPIMERRTQDNRLLVQRKIDNWSNRVDPEANRADANESMIARMKDRHRNQVKMAALRQQELQGGFPHMVPQPYGAPQQQSLASNNVVLPHPGIMMDPAQMYYASQPPMHDMTMMNNSHPVMVTSSAAAAPQPPVALPDSFLPNPTHVTLSVPHKKEGQEEQMEHQRHSMQPPLVLSKSMSTPTINPRKSAMPPPLPSRPMMGLSNNSSFSSNHTHTSAKQQVINSASSSVASMSSSAHSPAPSPSSPPAQQPDDIDTKTIHKDTDSAIIESPIPIADTPKPTTEEDDDDLAAGVEADAESSDDEERKSVLLRKKKSSRKLRQRSDDNDSIHHRQVRSSRSTPNLKKKLSKKTGSSSKASSRRTSQDFTATSSPPSEMINTPPPLPTQYHEDYVLPRSNSNHQLAQHQQQVMQQHQQQQQYRQSLRHMRSEPDLPRSGHRMNPNAGYHQQQQQLNMEWERMQAYQREQQLKSQYQKQQQHMSFMPMYPQGYYPNATTGTPNTSAMHASMMPPYSGNNGVMQQDHRASHIMYSNNGNNGMMYPQQFHQQQHMAGYYQASSSR